MKKIQFEPNVPAEIRAIPRHIAMTILEAIHRYAETGAGRVKPSLASLRVSSGFARATTASSSRKPPTRLPSTASGIAATLTADLGGHPSRTRCRPPLQDSLYTGAVKHWKGGGLKVGAQDFERLETQGHETHAEHRVWQDVYRPKTPAGEVYRKLTVLDDLLIVSFKGF